MEDLLKAVKSVDMTRAHESTRNSMLKRSRDDGTNLNTKKQRTNHRERVVPSTADSSKEADTS